MHKHQYALCDRTDTMYVGVLLTYINVRIQWQNTASVHSHIWILKCSITTYTSLPMIITGKLDNGVRNTHAVAIL